MTDAERITADTLNVVQQALKGALLSIAAASRADLVQCATLMQAFVGDHDALDPRAQAILLDLSEGFDRLGRAAQGETGVN